MPIGPFLIVVPATVISQWVNELKLWTTSLPREIPILTFQSAFSTNDLSSETHKLNKKKQIID